MPTARGVLGVANHNLSGSLPKVFSSQGCLYKTHFSFTHIVYFV